ncbi:MAG: hypothetical protein QF685_01485 [Verrucomicrobiota bacterium]|jgi:hypothetical protein|nr:hypothetical protein [Verrucomicrobiota bacterium]
MHARMMARKKLVRLTSAVVIAGGMPRDRKINTSPVISKLMGNAVLVFMKEGSSRVAPNKRK